MLEALPWRSIMKDRTIAKNIVIPDILIDVWRLTERTFATVFKMRMFGRSRWWSYDRSWTKRRDNVSYQLDKAGVMMLWWMRKMIDLHDLLRWMMFVESVILSVLLVITVINKKIPWFWQVVNTCIHPESAVYTAYANYPLYIEADSLIGIYPFRRYTVVFIIHQCASFISIFGIHWERL